LIIWQCKPAVDGMLYIYFLFKKRLIVVYADESKGFYLDDATIYWLPWCFPSTFVTKFINGV